MKKHLIAIPVLALVGACTTAPQLAREPHPDAGAMNWKPLFAQDLSDADCEPGTWGYTKEGALTPFKDLPIWTKADYENYVLDFEYKMQPGGNSGAFIYVSHLDNLPPNKVVKYKIEVQLLDDYSANHKDELPYQWSGSLYGRAPALGIVSKPAGQWNRMTITCRGKSVRVVHNGFVVIDSNLDDWKDPLVNPDGTPVPSWHRGFPALSTIPTRGRVGFQGRHENTGVELRNLRIAPCL